MDPGVAAPLAAGPSLARAGLMVAPAMAVANGLNYAFNLVMLRLLEPAAYGALGALLAVILIGTVPGLALQAVVARHTALRAGDRRAVAELWSRTLVAVSWVSLGLGLAVAAAAPALAAFLHLGSIVPALWLAANILPLPLVSVLQGVQRFGALAAALLLNAGARLAVGVGLVAAGHGVDGALAASVAGSVLAMLLPLTLLRPMLAGRGVPSGAPPGGRARGRGGCAGVPRAAAADQRGPAAGPPLPGRGAVGAVRGGRGGRQDRLLGAAVRGHDRVPAPGDRGGRPPAPAGPRRRGDHRARGRADGRGGGRAGAGGDAAVRRRLPGRWTGPAAVRRARHRPGAGAAPAVLGHRGR